jgi:aspartate/methionine/tyrosine aminotransferase/methylase of polypeptide subunit release factors
MPLPALDPSALLASPDPVRALEAWGRETPMRLAPALHALAAALREREHPTLRALPLELSFGEHAARLDLLLLPSIFAPEAWGSTFLEGLLRRPLRSYRGAKILELGTGSGWVALALLSLTEAERVLGVDLNPQAVLVARLNAVLKGYDALGRERPGRLAARFSSAESDLLKTPRDRGFRADLVMGCIPQVLASAQDLDSAEGLYDLSNYTTAQGLVEDQFGLGLNARALRESLTLLEPGGSVILNLAGRPGPGTLDRMFRRRGFEPAPLWRARVRQAGDTDIRPLVALEARTGSPFAFHLHPQSPESVSARVAQAALEGGKAIYHELLVVEGHPRSEALLELARALEALGFEDLLERLDLSEAGDEQLRFVTRLAEGFRRDPRAPYPHEAGDAGFRERLAGFLRKFHGLPLDAAEVFAAPSRAELAHALALAFGGPGVRIAASQALRPVLGPAFAKAGADPVWVHDDGDEIAELLPVLKPRLVILASPKGDLARLLAACEASGAFLALDESDRFAIGSRSPENPGLAFLARNLGSGHLAVMTGLIRSEAFPDLALGLLFTRHAPLHQALEVIADLSWSRISCFHQAYYDSLFDELLSFRSSAALDGDPIQAPAPAQGPGLAPLMRELLAFPAFSRPAPEGDVIRLDYGENELPLPLRLQESVLEGFLAPPAAPRPTRPEARAAITRYLRATRLPEAREDQVVLGAGTLPLLFDALLALRQGLGRPPAILLPRGSYGLFPALARLAGAEVRILPTEAPGFLATPDLVAAAGPFDALLLTNPANPSGAAYTADAFRALVRQAAAMGGRVLADEVFGLLARLDGSMPEPQDQWQGLPPAERAALMIFGGLSKEFAAGGLRLGWALSADADWLDAVASLHLDPLPISTQLAAERLFADETAWKAGVQALRGQLAARRTLLLEGLRGLGFALDGEDGGGLFLFPSVASLAASFAEEDGPEAFILDLERRARVRLNTPAWSGTGHHARACFSLPEARLREALDRLRKALA